jgi:hypothetical protein
MNNVLNARQYLTQAHSVRRRLCYIEDTKSGAQGTTAPSSVHDAHGDMAVCASRLFPVRLLDTWS